MAHFIKRTCIAATADALFDWHNHGDAFAQLTPPWAQVAMVDRTHETLCDGMRATIELRLGPVPLKWVAEHRDVIPGDQFTDVQLSGPFAQWTHTHRFIPDGERSILEDDITYTPKGGLLGRWIAGPMIAAQIARDFEYRHRVTRAAFGEPSDAAGYAAWVQRRLTPLWMRIVLMLAAVYNVLFGMWVGLFPTMLFDWVGIEPPTYPSLWQCIGMIVGVYAIGYALAATDAVRHWPIVLVGFAGKLLGPAGFLIATSTGELPWSFGWVIVTNDLIWWVPFALILYHAFKAQQSQHPSDPNVTFTP